MSHAALATDYHVLIANSQSLIMASCADNGDPDVSYAPFVRHQNAFYIYVSQLARHTGNLLRQQRASIMFIEPEAESVNPFARRRVTFDCAVTEIAKQQVEYNTLLALFHDRLGETVAVLRQLPDFHLLALTPTRGQFVAGFGKAFTLDPGHHALLPVDR